MRWMLLFLLAMLPVSAGCSQPKDRAFDPVGAKVREEMEKGTKEKPLAAQAPADKAEFVAVKDPPEPEKKAKPKPRKIRYTADLRVIVEDLDKATKDLKAAMKEFDATEGKSEISSAAGAVRTGTWRIRVPVAQFEDFREAVAKIGKVEKHTVDSEDMTAQYYDLQADIENRKAAREALRDLLKETGKKEMKHYLDVWDKLENVSGEINRKEGQLRLWADLTDLTTVSVTMRELQKFDAAKAPEAKEIPTFGMRAEKTWGDSWDALYSLVQFLAIVVIALTPWAPIPLTFLVVVYFLLRYIVRAKK